MLYRIVLILLPLFILADTSFSQPITEMPAFTEVPFMDVEAVMDYMSTF